MDRKSSNSIKWDVKGNELPMWVADMDFSVFPPILDSLKKVVDTKVFGYTNIPDEYFKAYQRWWKARHNVNFDPSWMIFSNGVVSSLDSLIRALSNHGDNILILTPVYNCFFSVIKNNNRNQIESRLILKEGKYQIDFVDFENKIKQYKPKLFILCNPHNPVGRVWSKSELQEISNICKRYDVQIISDEIHCDITSPNIKYNPMHLIDDSVITCLSATKAFNLAGIQSSVVVIKDKKTHDLIQEAFYHDDIGEPNVFALDPIITAFNHGDKWIDELNQYLEINKQEVYSFISKELPHIKIIKAEGTYLLWLDISFYSSDADNFVKQLKEKTGLILSSGHIYGDDKHVRLNVGTSLNNVKDGLNRLRKYLNELERK